MLLIKPVEADVKIKLSNAIAVGASKKIGIGLHIVKIFTADLTDDVSLFAPLYNE